MTIDLADVAALAVVGCLLWAAWSDIAVRMIPDGACIAVALIGLALRGRLGLSPVLLSLGIALALFLALVVLHARGLFGGGDVKLVAAMAIGLTPLQVARFLLLTSIAGFVLAMLYLIMRRLPLAAPRGPGLWRRVLTAEVWRIRRRGSLPYGVAIACGGAWVLFTTPGG